MIRFTKNQLLILSIFYANPGKSFYLRQLSRLLNKEPGVFQRDINNLEKQGIISSEYQGNNRFLILNKSYPLYEEIKKIIKKTSGFENTIREKLKSLAGIKQAFIYGSFTNKTYDNFSDLDLIIVGNPDQEKLDILLKLLEKQYDREINYNLYSVREFQKKRRSDLFLREIFKTKVIKII